MPAEDRRSFLLYSVIACAWTWALWIPALIYSAKTGAVLPTIDAGPAAWQDLEGTALAFAVMFQLAVYGPFLAAAIVLITTRRDRLDEWGASLVRFRAPIRWWAFVAAWPVVLGVLVVAICWLLGRQAPEFGAMPAASVVLTMVLVQLATSGLEEPGWRGFGVPLLQRTYDFENANWYLGLVWALWHVPFMVYLNRQAPIWMLPLTLAGFAMSIIAMGYAQAWVYNATKSVPANVVLHAWANVVNTVVIMVQPSPLVPFATAGVAWALAAWILWREKRSTPEGLPA